MMPMCNGSCADFMATSGLPRQQPVEVSLADAQVAIVACMGLSLGAAQIRCLETARALTARGTASICLPGCGADTLRRMSGLRLLGVVFIRNLPEFNLLKDYVRPSTCSVLLDTLDMSPIYHARSCLQRGYLEQIDGIIANNHASLTRVLENCPLLKIKPFHLIEHFHSVTRRVSDGSRWRAKPRALLVQEHRMMHQHGYCDGIRQALPKDTDFECRPLWGGFNAPKNRVAFLSEHLQLDRAAVRTIAAQHFGTGAMFTQVYKEWDLLIQWLPTNSSAQRLINALASGVPVVGLRCAPFEEAVAGNPDILLASDLEEMRQMTNRLASSEAFRRRVSDAGVAVAQRFTPEAICNLYLDAFRAPYPPAPRKPLRCETT